MNTHGSVNFKAFLMYKPKHQHISYYYTKGSEPKWPISNLEWEIVHSTNMNLKVGISISIHEILLI